MLEVTVLHDVVSMVMLLIAFRHCGQREIATRDKICTIVCCRRSTDELWREKGMSERS